MSVPTSVPIATAGGVPPGIPVGPAADAVPSPARPADPWDLVLGPATRMLWRARDTVHLELGGRAVVVEGLPRWVITGLAVRTPRAGRSPAPAVDARTRAVLRQLVDDGFLWTRASAAADPRLAPPRPRLSGELTSLAVRAGERAAAMLAARRRRTVTLHGHPRLTGPLGSLLAAAGIGRVHCGVSGTARLSHAAPGGLTPADEGAELAHALPDVLSRAAPEVDTLPPPPDTPADLVVLATDTPVDDDRRVGLHASGTVHLVVSLAHDRGVVGPLVIPGRTSCLRCADLHRRDRDAMWPALAAQLCVPTRYATSCDVVTGALVVSIAAREVLHHLDGHHAATVDGSLEIDPEDWRVRRRTRAVHPDCGCGATRGRTTSAAGAGWAQ